MSESVLLVDPKLGALAAVGLAAAFGYSGTAPLMPLLANVVLSLIGYVATSRMVLAMRPSFIKARLFGIDLNKPSTKRDANGVLIRPYEGPQVPEAMGVIAGTVYLVIMFFFMPLPFLHEYHTWGSTVGGSWGVGRSETVGVKGGAVYRDGAEIRTRSHRATTLRARALLRATPRVSLSKRLHS